MKRLPVGANAAKPDNEPDVTRFVPSPVAVGPSSRSNAHHDADQLALSTPRLGMSADLTNNEQGGDGGCHTRIPISAAIGTVAALSIVAVASMALGITLTSSVSAVDDVGRKYAEALIADGRRTVTRMFQTNTDAALAMAAFYNQPTGFMLPSDAAAASPNDDPYIALDQTTQIMLTSRLMGPHISRSTMFFTDGSVIDISNGPAPGTVLVTSGIGSTAVAVIQNMTMRLRLLQLSTMQQLGTDIYQPTVDPRSSIVREGFATLGVMGLGSWVASTTISATEVLLPFAYPISNQSGFVALASVALDVLSGAVTAVRALEKTPQSEIFLLDTIPTVVASTHSAPSVTTTATTDANFTLGRQCSNSAEAIGETNGANYTLACRALASEHPFSELRSLASEHPDWLVAPPDVISVNHFNTNGKTFYVARGGIGSEFNGPFASLFTLVLIMPEADILGGIVDSRNGAIIAVVVGTVVLAALCALLITFFLRPLTDIADRMRRMSQLSISDDPSGTDHSELPVAIGREMIGLRDAYVALDVALQSFTRYVPRDVVKDLMASGELCAIAMVPKQCTMLFVDIAGFTSMCERVSPDELSELVRLYFERMSSLVMGHAGLIDKYVGDCIMAVWGAPFAVANAEVKAVLCGLRLVRETRVAPLADRFDAAGERLRVRVGIASGAVLAGNMGSAERMNYTVIGDSVNLAARLESLNKQFGTEVLVCERTAERAQAVLSMRLLMAIRVVGKATAVRVYEPVGVTPESGHTPRTAAEAAVPSATPRFKLHSKIESDLAFAEQSVVGAFLNLSDDLSNPSAASPLAGSSRSRRVASRAPPSVHATPLGADSLPTPRNQQHRKQSLGMGNALPKRMFDERLRADRLVVEAVHLDPLPLLCTQLDLQCADVYSEAVVRYTHRDFAGALTLLERHKALSTLRCEQAASSAEQTKAPFDPRDSLRSVDDVAALVGDLDPSDGEDDDDDVSASGGTSASIAGSTSTAAPGLHATTVVVMPSSSPLPAAPLQVHAQTPNNSGSAQPGQAASHNEHQDVAATTLARRCAAALATAPGDSFDGVWEAADK